MAKRTNMTTKVIVATTNKGGDGKTKTSILTAEYFSYVKGKKGLAIDLDPQCNFSSRFLEMEKGNERFSDLF